MKLIKRTTYTFETKVKSSSNRSFVTKVEKVACDNLVEASQLAKLFNAKLV